jgi:hypothetical protein
VSRDAREEPPVGEDVLGVHSTLVSAVEDLISNGIPRDEAINKATKVFIGMLPKIAGIITSELHRSKRELLQGLSEDRNELQSEIRRRHGLAFENYEAATYLAYELGADLHETYKDSIDSRGEDPTCEVLFLLHGRCCTIAAEILHLIKGGFSDGAVARQRTLHELTVTVDLISSHPELNLAERYIAYAMIEQYADMIAYQENAERLGQDRFTDEEVREIEKGRDQVLARYGSTFSRPNQWAAPLFPTQNKSITFKALQDRAGLGHKRPYYKYANHQIHAGPRAALLNLHTPPGGRFLSIGAGARSYGDFAETAHLALIDALACTACLMVYVQEYVDSDNWDRTIGLMCLRKLVEDAGLSLLRSSRKP